MYYQEDYTKSFAEEGARASLTTLLWGLGWKDIVGGVNGVPTVQQFNEVCGRIDRKANELRSNKLDLDGDAGSLHVGEQLLINYIADVGAKEVIFEMAQVRENIKSGETLDKMLGKIQRIFADLKPNAYKEADDPFVPMTWTTYVPVGQRTKGSLYGMETTERGLVITTANRYVIGTEDPTVARTLYMREGTDRTPGENADVPHKMILHNLVPVAEGISREPLKLYIAEKG